MEKRGNGQEKVVRLCENKVLTKPHNLFLTRPGERVLRAGFGDK